MSRMFTGSEETSPLGSGAVPVSEFVRHARHVLERALPLMWVSGEIANLTQASSGHLYFTLRDDTAQVRCVMYRAKAQRLPFRLAEGVRVEVRALPTLYEARGEFQLQVESIRQSGQGPLFEAFLRLKARLEAEGLFDPRHKRALPALPRCVGVVTSPQAAALRDVLASLARRAPHLPVILYPSPVQGDGAGARLAAMLATAGRRAGDDGVEVLILCRGGGSLEDLWAFNDEDLVRTVAACPVPVVSGVGHETDFSLCDFAADVRAATPTAAAELVSAGHLSARTRLTQLRQELTRHADRALDLRLEDLDRLRRRLLHPRERLARQAQALAALEHRFRLAVRTRLAQTRARMSALERRLATARPQTSQHAERLTRLAERLRAAITQTLARRQARLDACRTHLQHLNPQAVLARGYSIVRTADGHLLRQASDTEPGAHLVIQPASGRVWVKVEQLECAHEKNSLTQANENE